jgi:ABC-2 type transport system ATP-binding protein
MKIVEIENLCKDYPSFHLKDVSFALEEGRITGFIGRNGAGKTTTIKSMLNLVHPSGGQIRYFGMDLAGHEKEIKTRIGYSTGGVNYYPKKKLKELAAVTRLFYPNWDEAAYREYLSLFALDENKTPSELSEGMKVKCNLAMALSHRAEVLILDEPTSGLDPFSRDELLDLFGELKAHGVTILFSTHITSDLEKCADNIVYISKGEIRAFRPREDFMRENGRPGETLEEIFLRLEKEARA